MTIPIIEKVEMENIEEVRSPDPIRVDCLLPQGYFIPYNDDAEDDLLRRVIEQSAIEYERNQTMLELERIKNRQKAQEERVKHFASVKRKFQQFAQLDARNREFYVKLISDINSYEMGELIRVQVDQTFYAKFLQTLDNIRIHPEEKRRILAFICI